MIIAAFQQVPSWTGRIAVRFDVPIKQTSMETIQRRVAARFNIRVSDMSSARRAKAVARPRQVAMYLCRRHTPRSLPEIGRYFGRRDHTTVIHAIKRISELRLIDRDLDEQIAWVEAELLS